ncbi:MAG: hypothetical protein AB1540_08705 [Bdellovibrionota bacterium]
MKKDTNSDMNFDHFWDFSYPEQTEIRFQEILCGLKSLDKPNPSLRIELLTQIARSQGLQGKLLEAEATLSDAETCLDQNISNYQVSARVRFLLEKGRILCLLKTPALARPLLSEAWTLASQSGEDFHAIDAAQMMASIEPPKMQKDWTLKALGLAESSMDPRAKQWLGALYSTLGWHAYELHQYDKAMELFSKALHCLQSDLEASNNDSVLIKRVLVAKWSVAKTLRVQGHVEAALKIQEELMAELQRSDSRNGDVCEELAECLTLLKRTNEAAVYFEIAYNELSKDERVVDNMPDRMRRLKSLGKVK